MNITAKNRSRLLSISANTSRQLTVAAINMAIPLWVVWMSSKEIWGAFVSLLLFVLIAQQVVNWGNKEYLVREFSQSPARIAKEHSAILTTRFPLVLLFTAMAAIWFPMEYIGYIFLWLAGRFLTQSCEALVVFEKDFNASLWIEIACVGFFFALFWFWQVSLFMVLAFYSLYQFIRGIAYFFRFRRFVKSGSLEFKKPFFKKALPFFLLSVLGFLVSKADVYAVDYFTPSTVTAEYQIINSLLVFVASASAFVYAPFTKNLYRSNVEVVQRTHRLVIISGLAIIPPALVCIHYVLLFYLAVSFSWPFYALAILYIFPHFAYGTKVISLFRENREKRVIAILASSAICNIAVSSVLLYFGYGIIGALAGAVAAQFLNWFLFSRRTAQKYQSKT